nr:NAD(P)(+) transhydrogenase (Re/Si-specific) subunit beta [Brucella sp. 09RB8910]
MRSLSSPRFAGAPELRRSGADYRRHRYCGGIGAVIARRIAMTAMPQLVAAFHSTDRPCCRSGGCCRTLFAAFFGIGEVGQIHGQALIESRSRGHCAITFTGSIIAFLKLDGACRASRSCCQAARHQCGSGRSHRASDRRADQHGKPFVFWLIVLLALVFGVLIIVPIGGADMPVVVHAELLFGLGGRWHRLHVGNLALIITARWWVRRVRSVLHQCARMNRSFMFGHSRRLCGDTSSAAAASRATPGQAGFCDDAAFILKNASKVIIVPALWHGGGAGPACAARNGRQAEGRRRGSEIRHPPGRGPYAGHMNVLLAEANVPYDEVFELEDINSEFATADVAFVIGANDVTNPAAKTDPKSPIFGMPISMWTRPERSSSSSAAWVPAMRAWRTNSSSATTP